MFLVFMVLCNFFVLSVVLTSFSALFVVANITVTILITVFLLNCRVLSVYTKYCFRLDLAECVVFFMLIEKIATLEMFILLLLRYLSTKN